MKMILFILLITITKPSLDYSLPQFQHMIWEGSIGKIDNDITDEWSTQIWEGDISHAGVGYYKAILFYSRNALERYLVKHDAGDSILIDVKRGKQLKVRQKEIKKTITVENEVLDHYEFEFKEQSDAEQKK